MRDHRIAAALLALAMAGPSAFAQQPPPHIGPRKTVAVEQFLATESSGGAVTADSMTAMLTDALGQDSRFLVVERQALATVQA